MTQARKPTILYVDDQVEVYHALVILLDRSGFSVRTASSCNEAFNVLDEAEIDLILLDVKMPEVDGYETCRKLKNDSRLRDIPVIFMTVCNEEEEIHRCFEVGGCDYVNKSISAEELRARVRTQLRLAKAIAEEDRERRVLSLALNNQQSLIAILDAAGTVLFANSAAENSFGGKSVVGRNFRQLIESHTDIWDTSVLDRALREKRQIIQRIHHEQQTLSMRVDPIVAQSGMLDALFIINRDITEELAAEGQLRQSDKMTSVGRLAGGIAHDLNNILGGMIGYISLLKAKTGPDAPISAILEQIESASERASDVVSKLLEFASVQKVAPKQLALNSEITRHMSELRASAPTELTIETKLAAKLPPVIIDPAQVKQLLLNLVYAASNAGARGGHVLIETGLEPDERVVSIRTTFRTVNAVALPGGDQFHLAESAGLGLAIVRDIVDLYEGRFEIDQPDDRSFSFGVCLPAIEVTQEEAATTTNTVRDHILVIDDEHIILQMMQDCFDMLGYKGFFAAGGREGLDMFVEHQDKIGLVVLDLIMPGINGEEVLVQLREIDPNIKVMISSAYSAAQKDQIQSKTQTQAYLSKPFKIQELQEMIERVLATD